MARTASELSRDTESGRGPAESSSDAHPKWVPEGPGGHFGVPGIGASIHPPSEMELQLQAVREVRWELDASGNRTGVHLRVEHASLSCSVELRSKDGEINLAAFQCDGSELPSGLQERIEDRLRRAGLSSEGLRVY